MSHEPETSEKTPTLTDEQRAKMEEWLRAHPYGDQDENGIDLSLLRESLKLTPTQRLQRLQSAADAFWEVKQNGRFTR